MGLRLVINRIMPDDLMSLIRRSGERKRSAASVTGALKGSLFTVGLFLGSQMIAFGRICGDGAMYFLVCDVMVDARYRGRGLEARIVRELNDFLRAKAPRGSQIYFVADKPLDEVCAKAGFKYLDDDFQTVMCKRNTEKR